jgi:hypothetical protein
VTHFAVADDNSAGNAIEQIDTLGITTDVDGLSTSNDGSGSVGVLCVAVTTQRESSRRRTATK